MDKNAIVADNKASLAALHIKSSGKYKLALAMIKRIEKMSKHKTYAGKELLKDEK